MNFRNVIVVTKILGVVPAHRKRAMEDKTHHLRRNLQCVHTPLIKNCRKVLTVIPGVGGEKPIRSSFETNGLL
jgi:hypothetical protein